MESITSRQVISKRRKPLPIARKKGGSLLFFPNGVPSSGSGKAGSKKAVSAIVSLFRSIFLNKKTNVPVCSEKNKAAGAFTAFRSKDDESSSWVLSKRKDYANGAGISKIVKIAGIAAGAAFIVAFGAMTVSAAGHAMTPDLGSIVLPNLEAETPILFSFLYPDSIEDSEQPAMDAPFLVATFSVQNYTLQPGDNLLGIAKRFGVTLDSLISLNGIRNAKRILAGTVLKIPNMAGIAYTVKKGDSISSISKAYSVEETVLLDANDLSSDTLQVGMNLFIPGAKLGSYELKKALGEMIIWPLSGRISSYFGYRMNPFDPSRREFHNGIDIVAPVGTPVRAAMDGRVGETGYSRLYGNYVILVHPDGYSTWYAHLSKYTVSKGQYVSQGDIIGKVGTTGRSSGAHLHFSILKGGTAINPLKLLQ